MGGSTWPSSLVDDVLLHLEIDAHGAPVTLQHLANRFSYYGVRLSTGDLQDGVIASDLGALGVLVDSPDAGGGRLVLNPFEVGQ